MFLASIPGIICSLIFVVLSCGVIRVGFSNAKQVLYHWATPQALLAILKHVYKLKIKEALWRSSEDIYINWT